MKHLVKKSVFHDAEKLDPKSMTVQGAALSVVELYKKMIVGSVDAAGYVHPIEYDENPDIDNPDPLNTFGLAVGDIEERIAAEHETARSEMEKAKAKKANPKKEPAEPSHDGEPPKDGDGTTE